MKRQSCLMHFILFMFTAGLGNIVYAIYVSNYNKRIAKSYSKSYSNTTPGIDYTQSEEYMEYVKYTKTRKNTDNFTVIDFETTGLSPKNSKIIQVSAIKYRNNDVVDRYVTYVNPQMHIPYDATNVNGITDRMVKNAPKIYEVLPILLDFIGGDVIIAHNASFDMKFLLHNMYIYKLLKINFSVIDTLSLARKHINTKNHKLETLKNFLALDVPSHDAYYDCIVCGELYKRIKEISG